MGSLQDYQPEIYFFNNSELYDQFSNAPPSIWGPYQQGPANMLAGITPFCLPVENPDDMVSFSMPAGMMVPESFNIESSYEALPPNSLSYGGYDCEDAFDMKQLEAYSDFPSFENDSRTNSIYPLIDHHPQLSNNSSEDDWACQVHEQVVPTMEEPSVKVGKYTAEERKDRILRYLKKRSQRNFNKTIKYACRKTLADKRVRVRGRFARNNETSFDGGDKGVTILNSHGVSVEEKDVYGDGIIKIKNDEDDWLQEAMASLMYFPYVSG